MVNQILEAGNGHYPFRNEHSTGVRVVLSEERRTTQDLESPGPQSSPCWLPGAPVHSSCFRQSPRLGSREIISGGIWEIRTVSSMAPSAFEDPRTEMKTINNFSLAPEAGSGEQTGLGRALAASSACVTLALVVYRHWCQSSRSLEFSYLGF